MVKVREPEDDRRIEVAGEELKADAVRCVPWCDVEELVNEGDLYLI